jgi:hypothetical protein
MRNADIQQPEKYSVSSRTLVKRTLDEIQKEARVFLHRLRRRDAAAVKQYFLLDPEAGTFSRLADAQYVIARKYGYRSWPDLKEHLAHKCREAHKL